MDRHEWRLESGDLRLHWTKEVRRKWVGRSGAGDHLTPWTEEERGRQEWILETT
jgi:hypothetical protein